MVRHRWELREDVAAPHGSGRRIRLRLGRGATLCILIGAVAWIAASLLFHPASGGGALLGEVRLEPDRAARHGVSGPPVAPGLQSQRPPGSPAAQDPAPPAEGTGGGRASAPPPDGGLSGVSSPGSAPGTAPQESRTLLVVHVAGAVRKPGVYEFAPGTRAGTAVAAAGGLTADADAAAVNLAAPVTDGTQLLIPVRGEAPAVPPPGGQGGQRSPGAPGGTAVPPGGAAPGAAVNINTATAAELDTLPGIGPVLAGSIVDFRQRNGPFASMAELDAVSGIGPAMMGKLEGLVSFQ
ncbi:MAG: helix-hairpin-helix domain-containing protein [Arthrobacter sp.]|uniref:ComEA family DNA-binding protein n=1 Tax=Arthrobacter sp. TaxID=1667 RepID=UPI00346EA283